MIAAAFPTILRGAFGLAVLISLAWLLSEDRRAVSPRLLLAGLGMQLGLALLLLKLPLAKELFLGLNGLVLALQSATRAGTGFVFGYLGGGEAPFEVIYPQNGFVLAFQALPLLLVISAPAALMVAGILVPHPCGGARDERLELERQYESTMDAIARGTLDAIPLFLGIAAMLVVLVALVTIANQVLGLFPEVWGEPLTLQRLLGWMMAPVMWLIGIPWAEAPTAGALMGIKTVLNDSLAYIELAALPDGALSERSRLIVTYALCGFANFGSLGIMIGGLGAMAPERRGEIVALGMKSILAGTVATLMTGAIVGMLL